MFSTTVSFAGIKIQFRCDREIFIDKKYEHFLINSNAHIDYVYQVNISSLPVIDGDVILEMMYTKYIQSDLGIVYYSYLEDFKNNSLVSYACCIENNSGNTIYLLNDDFLNIRVLLDIIDITRLLLMHNKVMLHCSCIEYMGKSILFTAPSGTGKSTQADLWSKYENTRIINGDRVALGFNDKNKLCSYGTPLCGSSKINENDILEVGAIIALSQSPVNSINPLQGINAYLKLYDGALFNAEYDGLEDKAYSIISSIIEKVPVYHLACTTDKRAVDILKQVLDDEVYN